MRPAVFVSVRIALLLAILFALILPIVSAATVTRKMPSQVKPGSTFTVDLVVSDAAEGKIFTIEETHPLQIDIIDWSVDGSKEAKELIEVRIKDQGFGWSFTPSWPSPTIHYTAKVSPTATGDLAFEAVYFDPNGFNKLPGSILVSSTDQPAKDSKQNPLETGSGQAKTTSTSPSGAATTPPSKTITQKGSIAIGVLIALTILIIGLGIFYAVTKRPSKNKNPFKDDAFFRRK